MRLAPRSWRTTAVAAAATLALTSCTPTEAPTRSPGPSSSASTPTPAAAGPTTATSPTGLPEAARPPKVGACYDLDFDEATAPTSDEAPVRCTRKHTAQTYYVGRLRTVVGGHLLAVDSRRAQRQVRRACPRKLARYIGGSRRDGRLARLEAVWFSPTIAQSDQGASWFRCDVLALGRGTTLTPLPPPRRLRGILDRSDGLDTVGLCGTTAPGEPGFERVICSLPHAWRALTTIDLEQVRGPGEETCRDLVSEASGSPEEFRYGWEWPTRKQWRAGQRFGYCWAPE